MKKTLRIGRRWGAFMAVAVLAGLLVPFSGVAQANHGSSAIAPGSARVLDVLPDDAERGAGATHTLTAVLCAFGQQPNPDPTASPDTNCVQRPATFDTGPINIDFEFEPDQIFEEDSVNDPDNGYSPRTPDMTCSVPAGSATCPVSYTGTTSGGDEIRAWIDHDGDDGTTEADATELPDEREVPGASPPPPACLASGSAELDCTDVVTVTWDAGPPVTVDCDDANGPNTEEETFFFFVTE